MRSCQLPAEAGLVVKPQRATPPMPTDGERRRIPFRTDVADLVVVGQGESGRGAAGEGKGEVMTFDAHRGEEVIGLYGGPTVIVKTPGGMVSVQCSRVVIATGAAEIQPICPGSELEGVFTKRAAELLAEAGVDMPNAITISEHPLRFEGEGRRVEAGDRPRWHADSGGERRGRLWPPPAEWPLSHGQRPAGRDSW